MFAETGLNLSASMLVISVENDRGGGGERMEGAEG